MRFVPMALVAWALVGCGGSGDGGIETNAEAVRVAADRCAAVGWISGGSGDGEVLCTPPAVRSQEACVNAQGTWLDATDHRPERCILRTPDAGAPCNDGGDCAGDCEAGPPANHTCAATTAPACNPVSDGAHTLMECY